MIDIRWLSDKDLSVCLLEKIDLMENERLEYLPVNADEARKDVHELSNRLMAHGRVFKDMCVTLAAHAGCPGEILRLDPDVKHTLKCGFNRCNKVRAKKQENICWEIYYTDKFHRAKK